MPGQTASLAVVLLHGIGGSARGWPDQLAGLAAVGLEPITLDLPGFGAREPVDTLDFDAMSADVEGEIARRGLDRPVLLGHSLGGMVAQAMLRRRPLAYRAAVLCGTSPAFGSPDGELQRRFLADRLQPLESGRTMAELAPSIVAGILGPATGPAAEAARARATALMAAVSPRTYRAAVNAIVGFDERGNLGRIAVPVLCLAGEHDRNAPAAMMERMAGRIPGARYLCLPGVGHLPGLEAPEAFNRAVIDFIGTLPVTRP